MYVSLRPAHVASGSDGKLPEDVKDFSSYKRPPKPHQGDREGPLSSTSSLPGVSSPSEVCDEHQKKEEKKEEKKGEGTAGGGKAKRTEEYAKLKAASAASAYARGIFTKKEYLDDMAAVLQPRTEYTKHTYQYRMDNFTQELRKMYAKNMTQYGSNTLALIARQEDIVFGTAGRLNEGR